MYVAVKGGEKAIDNAHALLAEERRGDVGVPELTLDQIKQQMGLAVDRVMGEGSLYDPDLAALAIKQAQGDLVEAVFLLRAFRTTLPRLAVTTPVDTAAMTVRRRISATFKDLPGGQVLGPTYDYTHRLLDFALAAGAPAPPAPEGDPAVMADAMPRVTDILAYQDLIEPEAGDTDGEGKASADEGFLLALGYSTQRGYGRSHPFAGEIRMGEVAVEIVPEELGFAIEIGDITVTECQMINQFAGSATEPPQFTRGYGLMFGRSERKAMSMALVDRSLRARELGEEIEAPAQDEEFVLYHSDNVEAQGFVQHLKLPHYVDFQSELVLVRALRREAAARRSEAAE